MDTAIISTYFYFVLLTKELLTCCGYCGYPIRPQTLNCEVPGLNLLAVAGVPVGKGILSSLPSPLEST